jgi:hypothetical protein
MIGFLGIYHDEHRSVILRPIAYMGTDLRDHHLKARWHRLLTKWIRRIS